MQSWAYQVRTTGILATAQILVWHSPLLAAHRRLAESQQVKNKTKHVLETLCTAQKNITVVKLGNKSNKSKSFFFLFVSQLYIHKNMNMAILVLSDIIRDVKNYSVILLSILTLIN